MLFLFATWRGYGFKKEYLDIDSTHYIDYQLQKLNWQRKIITLFTPVYSLLLWLILVMYTIEVTKKGSAEFRYSALIVTSIYIFGVTFWAQFKKKKKQLARIDELLTELKNMQKELS